MHPRRGGWFDENGAKRKRDDRAVRRKGSFPERGRASNSKPIHVRESPRASRNRGGNEVLHAVTGLAGCLFVLGVAAVYWMLPGEGYREEGTMLGLEGDIGDRDWGRTGLVRGGMHHEAPRRGDSVSAELEALRIQQVEENTPRKQEEVEEKKEDPSDWLEGEEPEMMDTNDFFLASSALPEGWEGQASSYATVPFSMHAHPLRNHNPANPLLLSVWVYLSPDSSSTRQILASQPSRCRPHPSSPGISLALLQPQANDHYLLLSYTPQGHPKCIEIDTSNLHKPIPPDTWTHISVALSYSHIEPNHHFHIDLYIDAQLVYQSRPQILAPESTQPTHPTHTVIGQNLNAEHPLRGHLAVLALWMDTSHRTSSVFADRQPMIRALYRAGLNAQQILNLDAQGLAKSPTFLYPMDGQRYQLDKEHLEVESKLEESVNNFHGIIFRGIPSHSFTPKGPNRYPEYKRGTNPTPSLTPNQKKHVEQIGSIRRMHIRNAMVRTWDAYKKYAWGKDELLPISKTGHNNWGGVAATLVDSLDTLWIMGMKEEFLKGKKYVEEYLNFDNVGVISVFETNIRILGGLLSAYDLSGEDIFRIKAIDLADRLMLAFDSPSGLPYGQATLNTGRAFNVGWLQGSVLLSEVGTLQLEMRYMSKLTGDKNYAKKADKVYDILNKMNPPQGLYPIYLRNERNPPVFSNKKISFGAMGDSFYEYLLKVWLQGGKKERLYRKMYDRAIDGLMSTLVKTSTEGITYVADLIDGRIDHKMDHLACYLPGTLALGAYTHPEGLSNEIAQRDLRIGKALAYTCYQMYAMTNTGLSPEYVTFSPMSTPSNAPFYILRPEVLESFYILYKLTSDPVYREWGWEIFQAIEKHCRTSVAYASVKNVNRIGEGLDDRMESFFLAETLKYLYLLMGEDGDIDLLEKHVFNTEAHPLKMLSLVATKKTWAFG